MVKTLTVKHKNCTRKTLTKKGRGNTSTKTFWQQEKGKGKYIYSWGRGDNKTQVQHTGVITEAGKEQREEVNMVTTQREKTQTDTNTNLTGHDTNYVLQLLFVTNNCSKVPACWVISKMCKSKKIVKAIHSSQILDSSANFNIMLSLARSVSEMPAG